MVQRAIVVMPALKTSSKLTRISQDGHSANDLLRLYSALKSLSILVIISGICQGLEIEGITFATMQMTFQSMTRHTKQVAVAAIVVPARAEIAVFVAALPEGSVLLYIYPAP